MSQCNILLSNLSCVICDFVCFIHWSVWWLFSVWRFMTKVLIYVWLLSTFSSWKALGVLVNNKASKKYILDLCQFSFVWLSGTIKWKPLMPRMEFVDINWKSPSCLIHEFHQIDWKTTPAYHHDFNIYPILLLNLNERASLPHDLALPFLMQICSFLIQIWQVLLAYKKN